MKAKAGLQCEKHSMEGERQGESKIQAVGLQHSRFSKLVCLTRQNSIYLPVWVHLLLASVEVGLLYAVVASEQMKMCIIGFNLCRVNFGKAPCIPKVLFLLTIS